MADQGRNADGLGDTAETVNVVRFPGDWFGPLEELVPVGSDADWDREDVGSDDPEFDDEGHSYADAFWGEDAETVHRVGDAGRAGAPGGRTTRTRRRRRVIVPLGAIAVALAVASIVLIGNGSGKAPRPPVSRQPVAHPKSAPAATRTVTIAVREVSERRRPVTRTGGTAKSAGVVGMTTPAPSRTYAPALVAPPAAKGGETGPSPVTTTRTTSASTSKPRTSGAGSTSGDALPDLEQIQQQP